jgi:regulator of protease activity HflC (stomatin/prohibitin superfamily)
MFWILAVVLIVFFLVSAIKILREYERGVIFRLGRVIKVKGPGLILLIPVIDKMVKVSLRLVAMDVPPQDVITRDNVSVKVNAVIYFRVMDPTKATIEVENFLFATSQLSQTTLRSVCGQVELDELLAEREKINTRLQSILQAEAERERRAKVINAEGEFQAAARLTEAAGIITQHPEALQLRYLQTLREISSEGNSTTLFPIPIDLFRPFFREHKE